MKPCNEKLCNMSEVARRLGVHRQTVNYWRKKGWISVKRDYRGLPVLTDKDIKKLKKWMSTIREES